MANGIDGPADAVGSIGTASGRIRRFFEAIQQGHEFGVGPGVHDEPWTLEFQQIATSVYAETLSWGYLLGLSDAFEDCADLMLALGVPDNHAVEWTRIKQYLQFTAKAIREGADGPITDHEHKTASDIEPTTPPVMPFGKLAQLVSAAGAETLIDAGSKVEQLCGEYDSCPITEQEKIWLNRLHHGDRTIDIAVEIGYSERSLYRALHELWERLGVDTRTEAIALAFKNGWI